MTSVKSLQCELAILTKIYNVNHNMIEHPVGADLVKLSEISQLMTKISTITGKPVPAFIIDNQKNSIQKSLFTRTISALYNPIKKIKFINVR
jgi:hypothetical protein